MNIIINIKGILQKMNEIYKNLDLNDLEGEEWRDIQDYDGKYQISNMGRVKSIRDRYGNPIEKILRQIKDINGYLFVGLYKDGKRRIYKVHRLVATAFLENQSNLPCVNHKDEKPSNNIVDNLEWCSYKYNSNYGTCIQRRLASTDWKARTENTDYKARTENTDYKAIGRKNAEKLRNRQDQSKQVYQYSLDGELVVIWQSTAECGRNGYTQSAVAKCCKNCFNIEGNNIYKGYIWSYTPINQK